MANPDRATVPVSVSVLANPIADRWHFGIIALIAFLTLVDLFATQAILPSLQAQFDVSRATMGFAVNASTFGMAAASLAVGIFGRNLDRRNGIWISLALLAVPTVLLSTTRDIAIFAGLRVAQGLCMATAFTLTMAYLAEHSPAERATGALAAYVTGNVASNLFGRILSAAVADLGGLSINFQTFALLNLAGAALVWTTLKRTAHMMPDRRMRSNGSWRLVLGNRRLQSVLAIGFLILFVFIGTYTYVNFQLVELGLSPMQLGLVYFVFLPSLFTTPLGGLISRRLGDGAGIVLTLFLAVLGLIALFSNSLAVVLVGLAMVAVGTFLAQALATSQVGRIAESEKATASGTYLASYYTGGLFGSLVVGQIYDRFGWSISVLTLVATLVLAMLFAVPLRAMWSSYRNRQETALPNRSRQPHS
ncbi:MFS transporter [Sinorhizobium terangae]|uniref:MFS transporter n=1 Tax=Sinorhizobium terangae TaxID=110322 RepID=A0A6N7LM91_SINTE|nr:MFS transporter [Sinorhizobium terangae]MBB4188905.1 putative MFS family arabinose efflux permease [Sinorhizobium terangae]MQX17844.1 MFS transporter [Sinorhizobium terangae]MQX18300.1 MFS transporter [Sinorhizobium terangae]MQX19227.1 MFS transporter [Sinorhizobium terangae]WFU51261.1 MFS transporter [Sinorhizobium terangae]